VRQDPTDKNAEAEASEHQRSQDGVKKAGPVPYLVKLRERYEEERQREADRRRALAEDADRVADANDSHGGGKE
jgi:hypothetical protein